MRHHILHNCHSSC